MAAGSTVTGYSPSSQSSPSARTAAGSKSASLSRAVLVNRSPNMVGVTVMLRPVVRLVMVIGSHCVHGHRQSLRATPGPGQRLAIPLP